MTESVGPSSGIRQPPTSNQIFLGFATASLSGFGGVLPFARRMIVDERRWLSAEEFNEAFSLAQFIPGPNMLNFAIVFGSRSRGPLGATAAAAGLLIPPVAVVMVLGALYARFGQLPAMQRILEGLAAAAAGLIIAAAAKMAEPLFRRAAGPAPYVALIVFALIALLRWPMLWVLIAAAPLSVLLAWWWRR
ncbi:MAG TPA: chromate transporter [Xanthobacteraceae bacterium]|nr:chromate transporter [Xanthobacteraceae bacterium]